MLRTVIILSDKAFISGGQAKVAIESAIALAKRGLEVQFFAPVGPVDERLVQSDVVVHCLGQSDILSNNNRIAAGLTGIWNLSAARKLKQLLARFSQHDTVIHCHGFAKALSPAIGPVLASTPIPSLFTMHEYFLACPNGGFYDYQKEEICHRDPLSLSCLKTNCDKRSRSHKAWRVVRSAVQFSIGRLPRCLDHIAYLSHVQLEAMRLYLPASSTLHYLPNPVAKTKLSKLADCKANDSFLFVGRFSPEKGALHFAKAAAMAGVSATFIGDGDERCDIEAAYPQAKMLGWMKPERVQEEMLKGRALVFPSLWYDCQPLVPFEAIQLGLPVICGKWNAASEAVQNNRNGLILGDRSIEAMASALTELTDDGHEVFSGILDPAVREYPTEEQHLQRLLEIYREILVRRKQSPNR